jgi:hypothetical protein
LIAFPINFHPQTRVNLACNPYSVPFDIRGLSFNEFCRFIDTFIIGMASAPSLRSLRADRRGLLAYRHISCLCQQLALAFELRPAVSLTQINHVTNVWRAPISAASLIVARI